MYMMLLKIVIQIIIMMLLAPKPENMSPPQAKVSDYNFPTAKEDRNQMLLYGTRKVTGINNIFAGDLSQKDRIESVGFIIKSDITTATEYYVGFANAIAFGGETELQKISIEDQDIWDISEALDDNDDSIRGWINIPDFHDDKNGVRGYFTFYKGSDTQPADAYVNRFYPFPNYKGLSYIVFEKFYVGNSPRVSPLDYWVKRIPKTGIDAIDRYGDIDGDCNPAVVVYDILVKEEYGLGINKDFIDVNSFIACAKTLYDEGFGISLTYEDQYEGDKFVSEVMRTIAGALVEDSKTGVFKMKLARGDYNIDDLFVFNVSNVISVPSYARNTQERLFNEVHITYSNREKYYNNSVESFRNTGLRIERKDGVSAFNISFPWVTKPELASQLALREAIPNTVYMSSMELETPRIYGIEIGDPVVVSFDPLGIERMVYRVNDIDFGTFRNNTMRFSLIQDTFGIKFASFATPKPPQWSGFDFSAKPCYLNVIEAPYFFNNSGFKVLGFSEAPSSVGLRYEVYTDSSQFPTYEPNGLSNSFTPFGLLHEDIKEGDNILILSGELEVLKSMVDSKFKEGFNVALIKDGDKEEFINFKGVDFDPVSGLRRLTGVNRGLIDTIPKAWSANAKIWFISYGFYINTEYNFQANDAISFKPLTITSSEKLNLNDANVTTLTTGASPRNELPIAPVDLKINNEFFWNQNLGQEDLVLRYTVRTNNETKDVLKYTESNGSLTDDKPDNIIIKIFDNNDTLIKTYTEEVNSLTNTVIFTDEKTINPSGEYYPSLRVEIYSEKSSSVSLDKYDINVVRV